MDDTKRAKERVPHTPVLRVRILKSSFSNHYLPND